MNKYNQEPIFIENIESLKKVEQNIHWSQYLTFNCPTCSKIVKRKLCRLRENNYSLFCRSCSQKLKSPEQKELLKNKRKQTCLKKYGVENAMQSNIVKNKIKQTCLEKYNIDSFSKTKKFKDKIKQTWDNKSKEEKQKIVDKNKQTCLEKYGVDNGAKTTLSKEKYKQTCLEKYGVPCTFLDSNQKEKTKKTLFEKYGTDNISTVKSVREKFTNTMRERYGVDSPLQLQSFQEKAKQTWMKKYEVDHPMKLKECKDKARNCCFKKYGVINPMQINFVKEKSRQTWSQKTPEELKLIRSKSSKKYEYEIQFDSSWELAVWIWAKEQGLNIKKEPVSFEYEFENQKHIYYPDFEIDGKLIEVKGPQFFKEDGTMQNPFDHSKDPLFEAKHQCGLVNGVEFWGEKELKPILKYIKEKYGKDYLKKFRNKS